MRRYAVVGVLVAGLLAVACGDKKDPLGPTATVPRETTTTDPYAVPSVIDEAYVNRVLAGLDHSMGEVVRLVVNTKSIPPEALNRLNAAYANEALLQLRIELLQDDIDHGFPGLRLPPGDPASAVTDLFTASDRCVFAAIDRDYSQLDESRTETTRHQWIALQPASTPRDFLNPTGWEYVYDGFEPDGGGPRDPCET